MGRPSQIGAGTPSTLLPSLGTFDGKHDLGIHSEMGAPGIIDLIDKGIVTGRYTNTHPGVGPTFCPDRHKHQRAEVGRVQPEGRTPGVAGRGKYQGGLANRQHVHHQQRVVGGPCLAKSIRRRCSGAGWWQERVARRSCTSGRRSQREEGASFS